MQLWLPDTLSSRLYDHLASAGAALIHERSDMRKIKLGATGYGRVGDS